MEHALEQALLALTVADIDAAAVALARTYAREMDADPECVAKVGPLLLQCLESLGMTPRSRVKGGGADDRTSNPLDELRQRRRARRDGTPPMDAAAT